MSSITYSEAFETSCISQTEPHEYFERARIAKEMNVIGQVTAGQENNRIKYLEFETKQNKCIVCI